MSSTKKVLKAGWVKKQGQKGWLSAANWKNRFFVLTSDGINYYRKGKWQEHDLSHRGSIKFTRRSYAESIEGEIEGHRFLFAISVMDRVYYVSAADANAKQAWIIAINQILGRRSSRLLRQNSVPATCRCMLHSPEEQKRGMTFTNDTRQVTTGKEKEREKGKEKGKEKENEERNEHENEKEQENENEDDGEKEKEKETETETETETEKERREKGRRNLVSQKGELLGTGGSADVYLRESDFQLVAVKVLRGGGSYKCAEFEREFGVLAKLRHANIVRLLDAFEWGGRYYIVMEYLSGGTLSKYLKALDGDTDKDWRIRIQIALDMAAGLAYLHSKNIIHCDLKSANILLDHGERAKISDFNWSKQQTSMAGEVSDLCKAWTYAWSAPELFLEDPINSKAADVYSFGVILWELGALMPPFVGVNPAEIASQVVSGQREDISVDTPVPIRVLIEKCWSLDSQQRPTMAEILEELKRM